MSFKLTQSRFNEILLLSSSNPGVVVEYPNIRSAFSASNSGDAIKLGRGPYSEGDLVLPDGNNISGTLGLRIEDGTLWATILAYRPIEGSLLYGAQK